MPAKSVTVTATYKKDEKPLAVVTKAPEAKDLRYNHLKQVLVERGAASGGTMMYALGSNNRTAPAESEFKLTLPTGEQPGYYHVWYYVCGDTSHASTDPLCVTAVIKKEDGSMPENAGSASASAFNSVPEFNELTTELHLVKGQKFTLPERGFGVSKKDRRYLTVSKSGAVSAKKVTGSANYVTLTNGKGRNIKVYISQPAFKDKVLKMDAGESRSCGFDPGDGALPFCYYSSAPDVAAVDPSTGKVTAVSRGSATITAFVNGKSYSCKVNVSESDIATSRTLHLNVGAVKNISVKGLKKVEWSIASGSCVEFVKTNKLKADSCGTAVLKTTYKGTEYRINVTVEDSSITTPGIGAKGNKYELSMDKGTSLQLSYGALDRFVAYKSSKPSVAYINEDGKLIAQGKGKAKLTTKLNGKNITITVNVK